MLAFIDWFIIEVSVACDHEHHSILELTAT
jgi:hypothetical protein